MTHNTVGDVGTAMDDYMNRAMALTALEVQAALLAIALQAREIDESVQYVALGDSDQGDWLVVEALLDADKVELDVDEYLDDDGYASHLYDNMGDVIKEFAPLVSGDERRGRHNPIYHLDVDKAITEIPKRIE